MDWKQEHPQYTFAALDDDSSIVSPWQLWTLWQEDAKSVLTYTNEIALATSDLQGNVSNRMVLLKISNEQEGFCWFTNKKSEKGSQIAQNPNAEILWFNSKQQRQVRVRGKVLEIEREAIIEYAHSRPLRSQISAFVSHQSQAIKSKEQLQQEFDAMYEKYQSADPTDIPIAEDWTGYKLIPNRFEFWQGRVDRLHDRICFNLSDGSWKKHRLYP